MDQPPTVFVVDDDDSVRESLQYLMESAKLRVRTFESAHDFLRGCKPGQPGCLVLDVRMPGIGGLELLESLEGHGLRLPVVFITAHADVPMAVRAMKLGAADFIEKPFDDKVLLDRVRRAIRSDGQSRQQQRDLETIRRCLAALTERERQVLDRVVTGKPNRVIAEELVLAEKTIEVYRSRLMTKMQADSLADLVRKCVQIEREDGTA